MKPARFAYVAPIELSGATGFLAEHGDDAKLLAGGQSLMPVLNMRLSRPSYLVDLNRVTGLEGIEANGDGVRIGALARHYELGDSDTIRRACPLLGEAIPYIGHSAIRHRGTIGGSIVHADPSAEIPAVMVALDAEFTLSGKGGSRTVPASEFFITYFTTAAEPTEILTEIRVPAQPAGRRVAICELARRHGDFALAGIALAADVDGAGRFGEVRMCGFGVDEVPSRLEAVERLVAGSELSDDLIAEVRAAASGAVSPESDMHATAEYRTEVIGVLAGRALQEAVGAGADSGEGNHG